jgi:RsiW-degrading membrane proteinase PrsW (M82 family)
MLQMAKPQGSSLGLDETTVMLLAQSSTTTDPTAGAIAAMAAMSGFFLLIGLVGIVFTVLIYYFIIKKAGLNPWLSLLMLVPVANFIVLLILAFSEWPVERENRALRAQLGVPPPGSIIMPT